MEEFTKPLGKWITETEPVERTVRKFNPQTRQLTEEKVVEQEKVKVIYEKSRIENVFCKPFEHSWYVSDSHKYIISCKNCLMNKHIMPGVEYIDGEGHVRSRSNDALIA
jgi:hypothetical protein